MKKQLLLASLFIGIVSTHSQNNQVKPSGSITNMAEKLASKYEVIYTARENENKPVNTVKPIGPQYGGQSNKAASTTINWAKISRSMNIYGMLEITSKPLQYNQELNTVSFVHRKSDTYASSPVATPSTAASGVIVGMVSTNCGTSWDSTCIWNNNTYWARFPQGGIYNPPGNTNLSNAYIVATGPLTQASNNWWGSYLASKKLDSPGGSGFNNMVSTVTAAQQQVINTNTSSPLYRFDFPSLDFSTSQDGIVKSLGLINRDFNATGSGRQFRGGRVLYGSFNSGVFNWTSDSIVADQIVVTNSFNGDKQLFGQPHMAWNESGSVGYVVLIGCRLGRTGSNRGFQPIIFKTTDGGLNWNEIPSIDFNLPIFKSKVLDRIQPVVTNSNLAIPMFNLTEGIACVVDKNDRLHIVSTIIGTRNEEADSLGFIYNFNNFDGEKYDFAHVPGARPYIYDFMQTSTNGWNVEIVDSMSSEAPGERSTNNGYNDNPWDPAGGNSGTDKVSSCARIQASRTVDGKYIVYSWAESDSNFTNNGRKWNSIPNVKMRAYNVNLGSVSTNEINLTVTNAFIASRAQMHHVAPTCGLISENLSNFTADLKVPITVSTNQSVPLTQLLPNDHWYSCSQLTFIFPPPDGINELSTKENSTLQSNIYPNPASNMVNISVQLKQSNNVKVQIVNLLGETVNSHVFKGEAGDNTLGVDLKDFTKGVYFVTIQSGNGSSSHKLIVD